MFKYVILLAALAIASAAAFFSVTGLGQLFAGAFIPVVLMAGCLEAGKLITAAFLTRHWDKLSKSLRTYYIAATVVLILITSAGIYGFLSNAYQQTAFDVESTQTQVDLYAGQRSAVQSDIDRFQSRIEILNQQRTSQQEQYKELTDGEDWVNATRVYSQIERSDSSISVLDGQISEQRVDALRLDSLLIVARTADLATAREIGGFRFIAENFNTDVDTVVKWFIFIIIFVFDPLAVSLVVGYNYIHKSNEVKEFPIYAGDKDDPDLIMDELETFVEIDLDNPHSNVLPYKELEVNNPMSNSSITIRDALELDDDHPAKIAAAELLAQKIFEDNT